MFSALAEDAPEDMDHTESSIEEIMEPPLEITTDDTQPHLPDSPSASETNQSKEPRFLRKTYRQGSRNRTISGRGSGNPDQESKQMTYEGLFDEVTDVRLTGSPGNVKEDIIIHQYLGGHEFAYQMNTVGLDAVQSGQEINLYDENGQLAAVILAPDMSDAAGAYSTDISVSLSGGGGYYYLTYTPNDAWLSDPARVYPVTVDPPIRMEYNYVSSTSPNAVLNPDYGMYIGKRGTATYYSYQRLVVPDEVKELLLTCSF